MRNVGRSDLRTPAKHNVLNAMLGREVSVVRYASKKMRIPLERLLWFDLTAGDGAIDGIASTTSPLLFAKHSLFRPGRPVEVQETEIQTETYAALLSSLERHMPHMRNGRGKGCYYEKTTESAWLANDHMSKYSVLNANGLDTDFSECGRGDWLFIYNDPNHIVDWALSPEPIATAVDRGARLCAMTTMGCNPGGLKRLPQDARELWFDHVAAMNQIAKRLKNIDNLLVEIERDASQWAYLLTRPYKWTVDNDREKIAEIYKQQNLSVKIFSMRDQTDDFDECLRRLFLRQKERAA